MDEQLRNRIFSDFQNASVLIGIIGIIFFFIKDNLKDYLTNFPEGLQVAAFLFGFVIIILLTYPAVMLILKGIFLIWSESDIPVITNWAKDFFEKENSNLTGTGYTLFFLAGSYFFIAIGFLLAELLFAIGITGFFTTYLPVLSPIIVTVFFILHSVYKYRK